MFHGCNTHQIGIRVVASRAELEQRVVLDVPQHQHARAVMARRRRPALASFDQMIEQGLRRLQQPFVGVEVVGREQLFEIALA